MKFSRRVLSALSGLALVASAGAASADGVNRTVAGTVSEVPVMAYKWDGFSVGLGLGVGVMTADINGSGSRSDEVDICGDECIIALVQRNSFDLSDTGGAGIFGTAQIAYDRKVHDRWVIGAFFDADWGSDIGADSKHRSTLDLSLGDTSFRLLDSSVKSEVEQDWSLTVGGRVGLLATPGTLLYVLAGYTHVELDDAHVK